jgi:hypothetical protein
VTQGTSAAVPEYEVKAALIYKIGKFIHWPERLFESSGGVLTICILGRDEFGDSIDALSGKRLQGQVIAIERAATIEQLPARCHITFISRSESERLSTRLNSLSRFPSLTVSDIDGFAAQGGMIGFTVADNKIKFQINSAACRKVGLEIGAQLLQLATLVTDNRAEPKQ